MTTTSHLLSTPEVCRITGVTYRQLSYWVRHGIISPTVHSDTSGRPHGWSQSDITEVFDIIERIGNCPLGHGGHGK